MTTCPHCAGALDVGRHGWGECIARDPAKFRALIAKRPVFCCICGALLKVTGKRGAPRKACTGACVRKAVALQMYRRAFGRLPAVCHSCGGVVASDVPCACSSRAGEAA